ncbi:mRNA-capping enzyme subunit beta [Colletotrichum chlorophyti]|uniref:mRNA-capping enzyme subunit beta n=1 Tax=Colletotrichum chlorophyti TaxID=708187 RepID=A0A1Q8S665_9PEZI|nr:mRNA-capping enzyme subunit beta [Colletotrichum chlorophyti]
MDLRSLMNTAEDGDRPRAAAAAAAAAAAPQALAPKQQHQQQQHPQPPYQQQSPTTPSQATTAYAFRESAYSHALHSSPSKPPVPQEYAVHPQNANASYPAQSPYQTPGPYPGRPAPPTPLQAGAPAPPYADPWSPQSASIQQHHNQPYPHGSPVATAHPPPEYNRQHSQPPTPLGPPQTGPRQSSTAPSFAQPQSPYQQRLSASHLAQAQATPPPPPPRMPSSHGGHDRRSLSQSDRDRTVSVSPKTRVPSLPSSVGGYTEPEARPHPSVSNMVEPERERAATPAKRKLADRDLSPQELERKEPRPPPAEVNGGTSLSRSPVMQRRRKVHPTPPIWAQTWNARENKRLKLANFELQKRGPPSVNGKTEPKQDSKSRHTSPEAARSTAPPVQEPPKSESLLGPWEESILGTRPYEELSKTIADFLFQNVVLHPDSGEILGRGVQFEIEAKMGQLIDRDTNSRVERAIGTECVLHDTGRLAFKSSMTEVQHRGLNDFLNAMVVQTDPRNPNARGRVQIHYKHRREVDKFYEIPNAMQARLPGCVRSLLSNRRSIKVRVTYDMKTKEVLAKIVKARVADIHIHIPTCPLDCRISINLEMPWDGSVEELEQLAVGHAEKFPDRNKDRLSYKQGHYQVDLTQVTQMMPGPGNTQRVDKEHELEVELAADILIDQQRRAMKNEPHQYQQLVEGFVDNMRVLARKSRDFV